jgi:hypothetical protein
VRLPPCEFYGSSLYNNRSFVVAAGLARQTGRRIIVRDFPGFGSGRQQRPSGVRVLASAASGLLQGGSRMASSHGKRIVPKGPCASCRTECFFGSDLHFQQSPTYSDFENGSVIIHPTGSATQCTDTMSRL